MQLVGFGRGPQASCIAREPATASLDRPSPGQRDAPSAAAKPVLAGMPTDQGKAIPMSDVFFPSAFAFVLE